MNTRIDINRAVHAHNDAIAARNRAFFAERGLLAVNVISSPGSGKTTLLERMAEHFGPRMAVVVGDLQTRRDADRVQKAGATAWQIETGGACHLDAGNVADAINAMEFPDETARIVVIENVGNLVCPSSFDLGEHMKIALLSVPEGDDKVLKYPSIFRRVGALLINKIDLLPHVDFDVDRAVRECASLNDHFEVFRMAAKTGDGVGEFCEWLSAKSENISA